MDLISATEYARHAGISSAAVSQQMASGRIPAYGPGGEKLLPGTKGRKFVIAAEADLARGKSRLRVNDDDEVDGVPVATRVVSTLTSARTATEETRSQLLQLEIEERRGKLMRVSKVEDAMASAGEKIIRIIDQLPMDADDLATSVARGGAQALRAALKEIARRMRTGIADSLSLGD